MLLSLALVASAVFGAGSNSAVSAATDGLAKARAERRAIQAEIDKTVAAYDRAQTKLAVTQETVEKNRRTLAESQAVLDAARAAMAKRANLSYRGGTVQLFELLISAPNVGVFSRRLKFIEKAASGDSAKLFDANRARLQTDEARRDLTERLEKEEALLDQSAAQTKSLTSKFKKAESLEQKLVAEKESALRQQQQRNAKAVRPTPGATTSAKPSPPALVPKQATAPKAEIALEATPTKAPVATKGGLRCPVDGPNSFTDTWGEPRSGGRRHQGVDIMAAYGTPTAAPIDGAISRKASSAAGGMSLYFKGVNGTEYFYAHLSRYAGVSEGQRISAGTHVGYVGTSGNASGTAPHLHFEVHPGGGAAINPYSTAKAACG